MEGDSEIRVLPGGLAECLKGLYRSSLERTPKPCDGSPGEDGNTLTEHLNVIPQHKHSPLRLRLLIPY